VGIRINQNVMAMNAYRNLTSSEGALSKSLERLSSGFRINRAADDAAGLVISEGLRSQVMGLKMATRNAQDGVSVVQTAEGALTETHSILQRMRELAVQAASTGSSDQPSRDAAQVEVVQLKAELDRIANTTKFGAQVLLDGNYGVQSGSVSNAAQPVALTTDATHNQFGVNFDGQGVVQVKLTSAVYATLGASPANDAANNAEALLLQTDLTNQTKAALASAGYKTTGFAYSVTVNNAVPAAPTFNIKVTDSNANGTFVLSTGTANDVLTTTGGQKLGFANGATATATGSSGTFQVGSGTSASDQISISIGDMSSAGINPGATGLSLAAVDVSQSTLSSANITSIDAAITKVSTLRGNLGAYQNRFEHTISNLSITTENLSASESRIRDTDMAAEMMSFTRAQILQQAGTAMLAQANAVPQTVLQLLK
jgi:flagellin